ncbi:MAG: HAD family hydrolase [Solirubrobacterales bacterium]
MPVATHAVLLDALGTLVELEPPFEPLTEALGGEIPIRTVERALRVEMAFYRAHSHEARDPASLAGLRRRCARLLSDGLGVEVSVETMMSAIRFRAFPDALPALSELRGRGLGLVCVSNWDCSLPEVLERVGLAGALDGVVASASAGVRKPDPAIYEAALELAGCGPAEALAVGDTPAEDLAGADAAGVPALLIDRSGAGTVAGGGTAVISSLSAISDHLRP